MGDSKKILQVRSSRQIPVRVRLLDDELFEDSIDRRAVGWILSERVCESLNLLEKDYFGLTYVDASGLKWWLNNDKKISKQMKGMNWDFTFEVKFYPPDPSQLAEDLTRYQLCLQIRRDIVNEKLPCSFVTYTLLGSYTAQSELGDHDTEEFGHGTKYLRDVKFAPHQDRELLQKIAELHKQHKGQTPEESELHFLENAKKLAMYGVEVHNATDAEGKDITLGVCSSGLIVYKDKQQINRFVWPKVLKISYRRNKYYIKIRPGEFEHFASLVGFRVSNVKMAKRLWKISIEHHSFFRFREPEPVKGVTLFPRFGSRFRYSGRTQFQSRQAVVDADRQSPYFDRVLSKRGTFHARTPAQRERDQARDERETHIRRGPDPPPEPKGPPPVAPKPKRGPPSVEDDDLPDKRDRVSLNESFDEMTTADRKSKLDRMHAVPTPLVAVMQKSMDKSRPESDSSNSHGPPGYMTDPEEDRHRQEDDGREERHGHGRREVIDQDVAPAPVERPPMSVKEEKEARRRDKALEKQRHKEEAMERKRIQKEQKAALAAEKKAAKQKSKQKGRPEPPVDLRERRDSKDSRDMSRDWQEAREQEDRKPATPDRTRKRLSSFEDLKTAADREEAADTEAPPPPPRPLPSDHGSQEDHHSDTISLDFEPIDSVQDYERDDRHDDHSHHDDHEKEEVSF